MLYYGRVLTTGVSPVEAGYVDFVERKVFAGFVTSSDSEGYVELAMDREMITFSVYDAPMVRSQTRVPGFFTMLGGPAFGPDALVKIIKHYEWNRVVLYFQNAPDDVVATEAFTSMALSEGIGFDLQKRESAGLAALEVDFADLVATQSNVFIFFGGSLRPLD